jgi:hypothetical protein
MNILHVWHIGILLDIHVQRERFGETTIATYPFLFRIIKQTYNHSYSDKEFKEGMYIIYNRQYCIEGKFRNFSYLDTITDS